MRVSSPTTTKENDPINSAFTDKIPGDDISDFNSNRIQTQFLQRPSDRSLGTAQLILVVCPQSLFAEKEKKEKMMDY